MGAVWEPDGGLRVSRALVVPAGDLRWRFSRSSGPGGQGVNTTDSRVELLLDVTQSSAFDDNQRTRVLDRLAGRLVDGVLTITASEHRSQLRNRDAAALRLALLLRDALAPPGRARRPTRPTRGSQQRRLDSKTRRGQTKRLRRPPTD
jgi:ribosome-associated protein